jgi:hypothetical protein
MQLTRSKKIVAGAVIGGAALTAGGAFALWSSTGNGSAEATARTAINITVTAAAGPADLYPGFTQGDLSFTMANQNPYPVTYTSMTAGTVTSGDPTNCPASNVTVANATGLSLLAPAGATAQPGSVPNVVSMASAAPDGCQGVHFTIAVTLSGSQS